MSDYNINYNLYLPSYSIGPDCYKEIPHVTRFFGKTAAVIGGKTAMAKAKKAMIDGVAGSDVKLLDFIEYGGDSTYENGDALIANPTVRDADMIFAVGGGRACDTGKYVADKLDKPLFTFPTVASNCASVTAISVIYNPDGSFREYYYPKLADHTFINTAVIADSPYDLLWAGIGDALATYFEAEANAKTEGMNFIGKGYRRCRAGMAIARECYDILMADGESALMAVKKHIVTEALENVIEANTLLSGLGFENTGCAGAHGIHSGFSEIESAHAYLHGEKVAFGLICQLVLENADYKLIDKIVRFLISVDLPVCLADINIEPSKENLDIIADHTLNHNPLIHNEPIIVSEASVKDAILMADMIGTNYKKGKYYLK